MFILILVLFLIVLNGYLLVLEDGIFIIMFLEFLYVRFVVSVLYEKYLLKWINILCFRCRY